MNTPGLPFGPGALAVVAVYLVSLLAIGAYAWKRRRDDSLADFYLGGREMGVWVLFLTLYATQYSGNTLFGFSGAAYREGLKFLVSVQFMTAIVAAYLLIAPRLYRLSRERGFITPGDYIYHRFGSHALRIVVTLMMIYVLCNFTLAQMKTLGTAFAGISGGRVPMWVGVIGLAIVMLVYESMGGLRSVAWTDVIQGAILMIGFMLLLVMALDHLGSLQSAVAKLAANPATRHQVEAPDATGAATWLSFLIMMGLGAAIYPQALQRIFAARDSRVLKRSLTVMGFMPLCTALVAVVVGVLMAAHRPNLGAELVTHGANAAVVPSETALVQLCLEIMQASEPGYWLVVFLFSAILAAVMSTADSAILTISSMITKDLYGRYLRPEAHQTHLTRVGKWVTWLLMVPVVWLALGYQGTLIRLFEIKFDVLLQCVPAFYLGAHSTRLTARTVLWGMVAGLGITLGLTFAGTLGWAEQDLSRLWGFHAGVLGLAANLLVCLVGITFTSKNFPRISQ